MLALDPENLGKQGGNQRRGKDDGQPGKIDNDGDGGHRMDLI